MNGTTKNGNGRYEIVWSLTDQMSDGLAGRGRRLREA